METQTTDVGGGQDASSTPESSPSQQQPLDFKGTKHRVKIDNEELEVPYEELVSDYQLKKASTKRFQQASEMMNQAKVVESLLHQASQGDLSWLKGIVPPEQIRKWAESELLEHIEYENLSEPEKRALQAERERDELRKKWEKKEQDEKSSRVMTLQQQAEQNLDIEIAESIKSLGHDAKVTPRLIKRIAEQIELELEQALGTPGYEPIPAKLASERAFKGFDKDVEEYLNIIPTDKAVKILPLRIREAIRKADVSDAQSQLPFGVRKQHDDDESIMSSTPKKSKLKKMSTDEYFKRLDKVLD